MKAIITEKNNLLIKQEARGRSAYQEWLRLGNSGTEQDFIDSLQGEQGEQGLQGEQGEQGLQGEQGEQGVPGEGGGGISITGINMPLASGVTIGHPWGSTGNNHVSVRWNTSDAGMLRAAPYLQSWNSDIEIDQIGFYTTLVQNNSSARIFIYSSNSMGAPSARVFLSNDIALPSGVVTQYNIAASLTLTANTLYWFGAQIQTRTTDLRTTASGNDPVLALNPDGAQTTTYRALAMAQDWATPPPEVWPFDINQLVINNAPLLYLRVA
jgi:hypothetical protein